MNGYINTTVSTFAVTVSIHQREKTKGEYLYFSQPNPVEVVDICWDSLFLQPNPVEFIQTPQTIIYRPTGLVCEV